MGTSQPQDQSMFSYKLETLEKMVAELRNQLQNYVLAREHDLQLKSIQSTVERIEHEVSLAKNELSNLNTKLTAQEIETQKRDAEQRESQAKIQISVLTWAVGIFVAIVLLLIAAYFTHILG